MNGWLTLKSSHSVTISDGYRMQNGFQLLPPFCAVFIKINKELIVISFSAILLENWEIFHVLFHLQVLLLLISLPFWHIWLPGNDGTL